ncbi:MAG TPA: CBS domain-containing protein [Saprospiraceae bacterium]|nr:CBS domain-containing protein [Saprospiraceae bacterium]
MTSRLLLRHFSNRKVDKKKDVIIVNDIMIKDPITISPDATVLDALEVMRNKQIGCLPVVDKNELVGIITETDFLRITGRLIDRMEHVEEDGE